jgi:thiamine biosynthesis protein ThiS
MKLVINGEEREFPRPVATLERLLEQLAVPAERTAVELNGAVIEQSRFTATELQDADRIEIVSFVGGG